MEYSFFSSILSVCAWGELLFYFQDQTMKKIQGQNLQSTFYKGKEGAWKALKEVNIQEIRSM